MIRVGMFNPSTVSSMLVLLSALVGCGENESGQETHSPSTDDAAQVVRGTEDIAPAVKDGFVTSAVCRECHQRQHASWHDSYHRTMTQEVNANTIRGNFDGEIHSVSGYPCRPFKTIDGFFMTLVHPRWDLQEIEAGRDPRRNQRPPLITYKIDRVIGSHHQQVYLSQGPDGGFHTMPLVWDITRARWITRAGSFLSKSDPDFYHKTKLWNNGCIFCHNTGPEPGLQQVSTSFGIQHTWNSRVVELGIACEACHGPGAAHAADSRQLAQAARDAGGTLDKSLIVNPAALPQKESVLVCSRCHGKMSAKKEFDRQCLVEGDFFRAGQWDYVDRYDHPFHKANAEYDESREGQYFWSDGTPRTTALEYQGIIQSPCYIDGEMTCLSCHTMHGSDPNDQLRFGDSPHDVVRHNQACTQCHKGMADSENLAQHTHHSATTAGSLCFNCHMPYQAYSLLKRVRSHRISLPSAVATARSGIPNACNQCHVDQTLHWTHRQLAEWQDMPAEPLKSNSVDVSLTISHALSGHALQRALAAEQLGAVENFKLAGVEWRSRVLLEMLEDDYSAVRLLAYEALQSLPGFDDYTFDYIAPAKERKIQIQDAQRRWRELTSAKDKSLLRSLLGGDDASEIDDLIDRLLLRRNQASIGVLE
jgi:hypothetical protein